MIQMIPAGTVWGITQARRTDFSLLAGAVGMGARTVRIGFEDSRYLDSQTQALANAPLVEKTVNMLRATVAVFWYGAQTYFASTALELLLVTLFDVGGGDTVLGLTTVGWIAFVLV